jgi:hypothetical protein
MGCRDMKSDECLERANLPTYLSPTSELNNDEGTDAASAPCAGPDTGVEAATAAFGVSVDMSAAFQAAVGCTDRCYGVSVKRNAITGLGQMAWVDDSKANGEVRGSRQRALRAARLSRIHIRDK